jgi:uncharacterized protein with ParB-like and HNH nuclease domain
MPNENEIKSEKILVKDVFSTMWFRIPEYQRPYIWSNDQVNELMDDLTFASKDKPDSEYFLGSFVFQFKKANVKLAQEFDENDLLDGQQRMTTLLMLFACLRDLTTDSAAKADCQACIYQKGSQYKKIPERNRLVFAIRDSVQEFVDKYIKADEGTNEVKAFEDIAKSETDTSLKNMSGAILEIRNFLQDQEKGVTPEDLLKFLLNNVLFIYVATKDLDDAFRLFTILNDRGVPLRNSDILKSLNLGELEKESEKIKYAKLWEDAESELGDDFDRFLNHLRTILVKEKARLGLLQEFEEKIYSPKEKEKSTGKRKSALLKKGKETFLLIERYLKHYNAVTGGANYDETGESFKFDNLVKVMMTGLPSTDWIPPLLRYFDRFGYTRLLEFLVKLDNKFSADWIVQLTPTERIEKMSEVIRVVEAAKNPQEVLSNGCFAFDTKTLIANLNGAVYGRRFTRYLLLKLDYIYHEHAHRMAFETLSVEHILPQNPISDGRWCHDFTDEEREIWTHRLGNLVLITRTKNASQGRLDYKEKKTKYFAGSINTCSNSLRVLQNKAWTPAELEENHGVVIRDLGKRYSVPTSQIEKVLQ